jgi:integrase
MASYKKIGKTWQYCISRMVNGKSDPIRKGGFATKKEAQVAAGDREKELREERENKTSLKKKHKPTLFPDYFREWVTVFKAGIGKNTRARYGDTLVDIEGYFSNTFIQDIDKRSYQAFLNKYGETHAITSTRKLNTHIRACVLDAIDEGVIEVNFTRKATLSGAVPVKTAAEKYLGYFDSKRLVKSIEKPTALSHYIILLGLASGMRFGEMVGLTRKDFDFNTNTITVNKTWGYTSKMHEGFGPTKNEQSKRKLKIAQTMMDLFKRFFATTPENIHGLVFYSPQSKYKVISNAGVNKELGIQLKKLNIEPIITAHGLRHTHASILLYKRVSIFYVSERLGHDSTETTIKTYAHIVKELRAEDEVAAIDHLQEMLA